MESFATCICKTTIPATHPYCFQNKSCLEYIIENVTYLFDDSVKKSEIESFVKLLPITENKKLIKKSIIDITELNTEIRQKLEQLTILPLDFLLPSVVKNFPAAIISLQQNEKMINLGKEIRKRNFSKPLIEKLDRLSLYFAIFFYESRNHSIWKTVLDSLIKAPYTPENLLQLLDTLFRQNVQEYLKFYATLSQNSSLTRIIYLIDAMKEKPSKSDAGQEMKDQEEIMSLSKLNNYAHHWFPGIVLASVNHPDLYKTTIEKTYEELFNWNTFQQTPGIFNKYHLYEGQPEMPQKINPQQKEILLALVTHPKVSTKILQKESINLDSDIRKSVVLSPNVIFSILDRLQHDTNEYIRKIALFNLLIMKKERNSNKISPNDETEGKPVKKIYAPNSVLNVFVENSDVDYF